MVEEMHLTGSWNQAVSPWAGHSTSRNCSPLGTEIIIPLVECRIEFNTELGSRWHIQRC